MMDKSTCGTTVALGNSKSGVGKTTSDGSLAADIVAGEAPCAAGLSRSPGFRFAIPGPASFQTIKSPVHQI